MNSNHLKASVIASLFGFVLATTTTVAPVQANGNTVGDGQPRTTTRQRRSPAPVLQVSPDKKPARSGINLKDLNTSISPRDDFYNYAVGGWREANPIPEDQARWGSFNILHDNNTKVLNDILVQAAENPQSRLERKLGNFYASGMDEAAINRAGYSPIASELKTISKIDSTVGVQEAMVLLNNQGINPYFSFSSAQDDKKATRIIGTFWQGGIGLPERGYYFREDADSQAVRDKYKAYMKSMFMLLGDTSAEADRAVANAYEVEEALAQASLPADEMRDPEKVYNLLTFKELQELAPGIAWKQYFKTRGIRVPKEVNVTVPQQLAAVGKIMSDESKVAAQRDYLRWVLINSAAQYLSSDFENARFNFYGKVISGSPAMKPRWKRVVGVVDNLVGQGLGQLYVKEHFSPEAKAKAQEMVQNILGAMKRTLKANTWMSPTTKEAALIKLSKFHAKIGYPDRPRDYTMLLLSANRFYDNVRNAKTFETKRELAKIGRPVDPNDWYMSPQTINAYYDPVCNEIVFPAGILQAPFFDPEADDAANYGGIGTVIGHEVSHGFDDQGAQYDGDGNLRNWWTKADFTAFNKRAKGVEDQFSSYEVNGQKINGKLVLGESIADLCGLRLSWSAYQEAHKNFIVEDMDGFSPVQRFYLNYAKVWATNIRPEAQRTQINTDPHPPAMWRVNGPLSNIRSFFGAFDVQEGDKMRRPQEQINDIW